MASPSRRYTRLSTFAALIALALIFLAFSSPAAASPARRLYGSWPPDGLPTRQVCQNFDLYDGRGPQNLDSVINLAKKEGLQWLKLTSAKLDSWDVETEEDFSACFGKHMKRLAVSGKITSMPMVGILLTVSRSHRTHAQALPAKPDRYPHRLRSSNKRVQPLRSTKCR